MLEPELFATVKLAIFDFDGVFTDNFVITGQDGSESIRSWRGDGVGLARLRQIGIQSIIVSSEINPVASVRGLKLNCRVDFGVEDKGERVRAICSELSVNPKTVMYLGNDINDIPALKVVGIPLGVQDSHRDILPFILGRTESMGGFGAVREVCDLICEATKKDIDYKAEQIIHKYTG